jgi:N-carbamoyl-L-amino-acid hydrolase
VLAGSHLDSQPNGGKFDGAYGVVAALEATAAIVASGTRPSRPIEVVAWCNEEGSRFPPGAMGSSAFSGAASLDDLLASTDGAGIAVREALGGVAAALPAIAMRPLGCDVAAYVEAHIEQGPILESEGATIGVVTGIQGVRWFTIDVRGQVGHAGTTPMQYRRDALQVAIDIIGAFRTRALAMGEDIRMTVGRLTVDPNSPNTIPGSVTFTIDLRHPEDAVIERLAVELAIICNQHTSSCVVEARTMLDMPARSFSPDVIAIIEATTAARGLARRRLMSGAFHDAKFLADICPTGMIFVPCAGGLSHNPAESATSADLLSGANVLAATMLTLANGPAR